MLFFVAYVQFYFLKYATDVLLLAPAIIGLLLGPGRLWDAVTDPVVGYLSDRTRSKLGRRRPWLFAAIPTLAASFAMIWLMPAGFGPTGQLVWLGTALFAFYTFFTFYYVPYLSFAAERSRNYHERSKIFGTARVFHLAGTFLAFAALQVSDTAEHPRETVGLIVLIAVIFASAALAVTPLLHRERPENQGRGSSSPYKAYRDVLGNPYARLVFVVILIDYIGIGVVGAVTPFFAQYVLGAKVAGYSFAAFAAGGILGIPFWLAISRRFDKKPSWIAAMLLTSAAYGSLFFAEAGQAWFLYVALFFAGAGGNAASSAVGQSILADIIDYDEYRTGERKEGAYSASWGFALKAGTGSVVMLAGIILQGAGYAPNVEQSADTVLALRGLMSLLPAAAFLIGALLFTRYRLDEAEHARIQTALDERRQTNDG